MKSSIMIKSAVAFILTSLLAATGCHSEHQRLAIAYVIDMTASVDNDAIMQAFAAIKPLLDGKALQRGDSITIIPITGDSLTESQGKILRFHLNENRAVYNSDLTALAKEVEEKLQQMRADVAASPYQHSDILGAADLAAEELATEKGKVRKVIVILSDFIQDDSKSNFNSSPDMANNRAAVDLAKKMSTSHAEKFAGATLYLGMLRSKDLKRMPNVRREAVQAFWQEYFKIGGASTVSLAIDGPGKVGTAFDRAD